MSDEPLPTELDPVTVTGARQNWGFYTGIDQTTPGVPPSDTPSIDDVDPGLGEAPEDRQKKECGAKQFRKDLNPFGRDAREYISFTYRQNGNIYSTGMISPGGSVITGREMLNVMNQYGFGRSDVLAFQHNHNENTYCSRPGGGLDRNADSVNRYPSSPDWDTADWLIEGGANPAELTLFVMSCSGDAIRGFDARLRDFFDGLSEPDKIRGLGLPPEVSGDACTPVGEAPQ